MARARQARRCSAHRKNGEPCRAWAINGGRVCRMHGGAAPQVRRKAGERLVMARAYRVMGALARSRDYQEHEALREQAGDPGAHRFRDALAAATARFEEG